GGGNAANARELLHPDPLADSFGGLYCTVQRCLRKDDGKLLPAISGREIDFAASRPDRFSDGLNDHVTTRMAEPVVDLLQEIEIDDQKRQRVIVALRAAQLDGKSCLKEPMIG